MMRGGRAGPTIEFSIDTGDPDMSLVDAACSFGYFLLAPNNFSRATQCWSRPVVVGIGGRSLCYHVQVRQSQQLGRIQVSAVLDGRCHALGRDTESAVSEIKKQICRSLRLHCANADARRKEYLKVRSALCKGTSAGLSSATTSSNATSSREGAETGIASAISSAAEQPPESRGYVFRGRLFRSPSLWEDAVKTITCTNIAWSGTRRMNAGLCSLRPQADGAFPTPEDVMACSEEEIRATAGVGYRAPRIRKLAELFASGAVDEACLSPPHCTAAAALDTVMKWPGVGPYAGRALCQLLGHFDFVPVDTETLRHLREYHGMSSLTLKTAPAAAERVYAPYQPSGTMFLAFWGELWEDYQRKLGRVSEMDPSEYDGFTAKRMTAAAKAGAGAGMGGEKLSMGGVAQGAVTMVGGTREESDGCAATVIIRPTSPSNAAGSMTACSCAQKAPSLLSIAQTGPGSPSRRSNGMVAAPFIGTPQGIRRTPQGIKRISRRTQAARVSRETPKRHQEGRRSYFLSSTETSETSETSMILTGRKRRRESIHIHGQSYASEAAADDGGGADESVLIDRGAPVKQVRHCG